MEFSEEGLLRQIVAETTKGLEPVVKALADIERSKQPKHEVKLATREETNSLMSALVRGYKPTREQESKTTVEKEVDNILQYTTKQWNK